MLKITYLEDEICLEHLDQSIAIWEAERILVNLRAAVSVYLEPSVASLVMPIEPCLRDLIGLAEKELIDLFPCDEEYIEVSFMGTWVAENKHSQIGIFVCELSPDSEFCLYRLWQESRLGTSIVRE